MEESTRMGLPHLPNELVDYIGMFVGIAVERDPPKRVGDLAFDKTHAV